MALFIIRHGETAWNAARIIQLPDTPLSERGIRQAELLGERLAGMAVTRIVVSDYRRALMTAERLHAATGAALEQDEQLRERHFGDLRGRPHAEVGDAYRLDLVPPGGESWNVFHQRVERAWAGLRHRVADDAGNIAVVTHGLVCYSLALRHLRPPVGIHLTPTFFNNASLTVVEATPPWTVTSLNDCEHLQSLANRATAGV
ncbi:MAG: histidine phosphatase family protein [Gammaproteobacteria bacterium]